MKRFIPLLCLFFFVSYDSFAQDAPTAVKKKPKVVLGGDGIYLRDSIWKVGGYLGATVSQTALYQWGPGGSNNFAVLFSANAYANYKKGKASWDNSFDGKWGMVANGLIRRSALAKQNFQKSIDLLAIKSTIGYEVSKNLYVSGRFSFESQFTRSFDYSQTDTVKGEYRRFTVSKFGAPAILTMGAGITWKPKDWFTLSFSPLTGKLTFVTKDSPGRNTDTLPDGRFTNSYYSNIDETRFGLLRGYSFMGELGAELDILFQKEVVKNVSIKSHLNVFSAYLNPNYNTVIPKYYAAEDSIGAINISKSNLHIPVVRWDNDIVFKVNKFLSATLSTRFVYQYNATVPIDTRTNGTGAKGADGVTDIDKFGKSIVAHNKLQIFEQFGVGLSFKF